MGKIIVKNIKGMSWKAKFSFIAMFTLVFSVLIYQGWQQLRNADAAIGMSAWTTLYNNATAYPSSTSVAYTIPAGSNRLLVLTVASNRSTVGTHTYTFTYGGQTLTEAISDRTLTAPRQHSGIYYLNEAGIQAATSSNFALTVSGGTANGVVIYATTLTNVDQAAPFTNASRNYNSGTTSATTAPAFATALTSSANDKPIAIVNAFTTGTGTATTLSAAANWTLPASGSAGNMTNASGTTYVMRAAALDRAIPTATVTTTTTTGALGTASLRSMSGVSVKAAITTLGNGVAGTTANVAPGAASQKIDGFSFVTSSAGTTGSVTGLTVTTTNQAAIASMQIWNEAGTTQYFATVNNPGSNTWAFSGGTAIPVTSTVANYKVLVTYKTRAGGAPAGNTATTANVTAFTTNNVAAGTDTADTTLTLLNTHAASTWGTNTAGDAQITLNWTYGTPGQSVIIIRYAGANTDTTKPVDGVTYTQGSAFGTGGTVAYNGAAATYTNTPLANGTTYYYKIFEYDSFNYYYNATDVWTAGLTPLSPDAVAPVVDPGFAATTPINSLVIPISGFTATDNSGGSGVSGYLITTSSGIPSAGAAGWTASPPSTFTVGADGSYTLYPWAKDGANNVSALYGSPVTVVVDRVAPTVDTFTAGASQVASKTIPITAFTASDATSGIGGYLITTSSAQPSAGAAGWSASPPSTYTVLTDATYDLYPWAKDGAGNVSAVATQQTVLVDTTAPTGLTLNSPADNALDLPVSVTMQVNAATDPAGGVGGVEYYFHIRDIDNTWSQNSAWQAGTSYSLGLSQGVTYIWRVKARDALGNETAFTTPRTFTIQAPCVRNAPTLTLLTGTGSTSGKITADGGTAPYILTIINNDVGSCGGTTFNLSVSDANDLYGAFQTPSTLDVSTATLNPQAQTTRTLTVKAQPEHISGSMRTTVTSAADANHPAVTSQYVQTVLNVVGCTPRTPLLLVGPNSGYVAKGGTLAYTVTVKNTDSGTGCSPVIYNMSRADSNSTDYNASSFSAGSITLNSGELGSVTLTVSAKATAAKDTVNNTTISLTSDGSHSNPLPKIVKSTVNNPMLHNSDNLASTRWGGWGLPGKKYGEFVCTTCHVTGDMSTKNIKRIREAITTPDTSNGTLPGNNAPIVFNRFVSSNPGQGVLGWDSSTTPRTSSTKVCEVCHTYDSKRNNGVMAHPYSSYSAGVPKTLGNHFSTDGTDCIRCHKHTKGFGVGGGACITCHGDDTATTITSATSYLIAPPKNTAGLSGTVTKPASQVNNNPKIGAHQTHLRMFNGFSNYSTVDGRCSYCHGPLPTNYSHINSSSSPAFQGLAVKGGMSPSFNSANVTCTNIYCHNPAASTVLKNPTNTGSNVFPTWTSSTYVVSNAKSIANCSVCHKVPGVSGFQPSGTHSGMSTDTQDCSGCHAHNGDTGGKLGQRHMDGILFGAGNCNSCHSYDTTDSGAWQFGVTNFGGMNEGVGAHAKHINYIKARWGVTLAATTDKFGLGAPAAVCGVCHTNVDANHSMGDSTQARLINFGESTVRKFGASNPIYNGSFNTSSSTNPKTCANIDCHYKQTPVWSSY